MEILKQKQYSPIDTEKQIVLLYAATKGYVDSLPLNRMVEFEERLFDTLDASHSDVLDELKNSGQLSDELDAKIKDIVENFVKGF